MWTHFILDIEKLFLFRTINLSFVLYSIKISQYFRWFKYSDDWPIV